jgi:hypothetical protein
MRARCLWILIVVLLLPATAAAQTAPGAWTEADKDGYGTRSTTGA